MRDLDGHVTSIVLIGKFNPAIFSPGWLAKVGLIGDEALAAAADTTEIVHRDVAKFHANDLRYEITKSRFQVQMTGDPAVKVCDTAAAIFGRLLPHTPLIQLGINLQQQFLLASLHQRTQFGRALAPTGPWGDFGKRIAASSGDQIGGMLSLTMRELGLSDRKKGWRQVTIEPVSKPKSELGVAVSVNDHFDFATDDKDSEDAKKVIASLQDRFESSLAEAKKIVLELIEFAEGFPA